MCDDVICIKYINGKCIVTVINVVQSKQLYSLPSVLKTVSFLFVVKSTVEIIELEPGMEELADKTQLKLLVLTK